MKIDFKVTSWERVIISEPYEQAVLAAIKAGNITSSNDVYEFMDEQLGCIDHLEYDTLFDSGTEQISVDDNDGEATIEVLMDIETVWDNGTNLYTKASKISAIKKIIAEWGTVTSSELQLDSSPCLSSIGNGKNNISELVEQFKHDGVETTTYHDENELTFNNYEYEELSDEIIDEILEIIQEYEADMLKTEKRCED